jgi:sugar O-acyltransferase (sialic acid O-acetyltransferase NeuD family)
MNEILAIFGAGAQGHVTLEAASVQFANAQFYVIDDRENAQELKEGFKKFPQFVDLVNFQTFCSLFKDKKIKIHSAAGNPFYRKKMADKILNANHELLTIIHPSAVILPSVKVGNGVFVGANAVVNTGAVLEDLSMVNTAAIVEHDSIIEFGATICPGACIGGKVKVKKNAFVGSRTTVRAFLEIGEASFVGMGSVVTKSVSERVLNLGYPSRNIRSITEDDFPKLI